VITELEFKSLSAQGYNRIPLVRETLADLDTPLSVYLKLANRPYSYLLESVVGGERFGRYSFIGLPARTLLRATGHAAQTTVTIPSPTAPTPRSVVWSPSILRILLWA
jgi:anthranilate synthase component 1